MHGRLTQSEPLCYRCARLTTSERFTERVLVLVPVDPRMRHSAHLLGSGEGSCSLASLLGHVDQEPDVAPERFQSFADERPELLPDLGLAERVIGRNQQHGGSIDRSGCVLVQAGGYKVHDLHSIVAAARMDGDLDEAAHEGSALLKIERPEAIANLALDLGRFAERGRAT